jgi:hypothetical protein
VRTHLSVVNFSVALVVLKIDVGLSVTVSVSSSGAVAISTILLTSELTWRKFTSSSPEYLHMSMCDACRCKHRSFGSCKKADEGVTTKPLMCGIGSDSQKLAISIFWQQDRNELCNNAASSEPSIMIFRKPFPPVLLNIETTEVRILAELAALVPRWGVAKNMMPQVR